MSDSRTCPQCGRTYGNDDRFCTVDGAALVAAGGTSLIGTVIADRFLVMNKLGEGGMGEVYLAEHVRMKRKVALKLMRPWMLGDPVAVGRFHREAENASQISHPNVAQVYDFGETADRIVYLAMEFVDGEPLSTILEREGTLHTVRTAEIVRQIGEALTAAHSMGILHRDLKPDNVMVARTRFGTDLCKLVDFGIARAMHRGTQQFTSTGLVVGTPDYMSPEQLSGDELDGRSDLYALALIAFRLLTGGAAWPEGSSGESMVARLTRPPKRLAEARPDIPWPASLQAAFDRALAADPAQRFADAMEFVAELDVAVSELPLGDAEEAYLVALSQRHATPVRGGVVLDAVTPARGTGPVRTVTPIVTSAIETPLPQPLPQDAGGRGSSPATDEAEVLPGGGSSQEAAAPPAHQEGAAPPSRAAGRKLVAPLAGVGIAAIALVAWLFTRGGEDVVTPAVVPAAADSSATALSTPADTPTAVSQAAPALAAGSDSAFIAAARRATLAVSAPDGGTGTAVLVDSTGFALTVASLMWPDSTVRIYLNANTLLQTRAVSVDRTTGLVAVRLPMRRCAGCGVVAPQLADPAVGDSVFVLPARGRGDGNPVRTVISTFDGRSIAVSAAAAGSNGAPLVSLSTGGLLALGGRRAVTPTALRDAVAALKSRPRGAETPGDSTIPIWPERAVATSLLGDDVMARIRTTWSSYRQDQGGLAVVVMTPQVMKYRANRADDPLNISRDPIKVWAPWQSYIGERRAVVIINASHEQAAFDKWPSGDVNFRRASVKSIQLFRDDTLVAPIETGTFPALATNGRQEIGSAGVAVYSALEFKTGNAFRVEVVDARSATPVSVVLKPGTLEVVRGDLAGVR